MMADLVGDHVGLREIAGRAEALRELVEERGVEIELLILGTVERSRRFARDPARGADAAGKQHERRRLIGAAQRLEDGAPDILGVAEHLGGE